ncbi:MAG: hypothetical protein H6858_04825 [Rhodospirillales bacterium]|nr:hypothetical protein [Rhodospirillales bacterium]
MLYGEYDNSGNLIREYVWLNGELLAQVDAGSPEVLTYLHTDHLMTPRAGSNAAGSTVWTWDSGAFGKEAATGSTTVNLRFPGQYFDSETGLHYNWNRYYNPAIGRYVSSDPIGLAGGLNTFGYAGQSPVNIIDFAGLDIAECMISSNPLLCSEGQGGAGTGPRNNSIAGGGVIGLCLIAAGGILEEAIHHAQQSDDSGGSSKPPVSTPGAQAGSPMPDPDDGDDKKKKAKERRAEQRQKALDEKGYDPQKKGTPTRNIDQNAQVDDVQRQLGLSQEQRAELHRRISGENKGYQEILEEAQRIKEGN